LDRAYRLLSFERSDISSFSNYEPQEYCRIKGIGKATACKIAAAVELGKRVYSTPIKKILLNTPDALAQHFSDMRNFHKEVLRIAMFNSKLELIKTVDISMGGLAHTSAVAREVFADAIRTGANAIVLAHNHPSGDPSPSKEDEKTTENLILAGKLIGIKVMDHIIIGDNSYVSFKERDILPKV
jgi:DNA repair protein RadC